MGRGWKRARKLSTAPVPYPTNRFAQLEKHPAIRRASLYYARHGGQGTGLGHGSLQSRPRRNLSGRPESRSTPASLQFHACAKCGPGIRSANHCRPQPGASPKALRSDDVLRRPGPIAEAQPKAPFLSPSDLAQTAFLSPTKGVKPWRSSTSLKSLRH